MRTNRPLEFIKKYGRRFGYAFILFAVQPASADLYVPINELYYIVGGQDNAFTTAYVVLVSPSGVATSLSGATPVGNGIILSVAINSSRAAIIGGKDVSNNTPYAALVSPSGVATAVTGATPVGFGIINGVAINSSGSAIIGGQENGSTTSYAALVSSSGIASLLTGAPPTGGGQIFGVAINDLGNAIVGGSYSGGLPYAAIVSPAGVATFVTGPAIPVGSGIIFDVAINSSGAGIIGGQDHGSANAYAALVSPSGVTTALSGVPLPVPGTINSVAINSSGAAIIGGRDNGTTNPYIALVSSSGVATSLSGAALPVGTGLISTVAINSSGAAIIGGRDHGTTTGYVALVSPSGVTTALSGDLLSGISEIDSVAISDSGAAIIAGEEQVPPLEGYIALVSPSGVATRITGHLPIPSAVMKSVALANVTSILTIVTPTSIGPAYGAPQISAMLAASRAVANHTEVFQNWRSERQGKPNQEIALLADNDLLLCKADNLQKTRSKKSNANNNPHHPRPDKASCSVWFAPFYDHASQDSREGFPSSTNQIAGATLGFDYWATDRVVLGGGLAYAFDDVDVEQSLGHAKINQGMAVYYTSYKGDYVFFNGSLWGGYYLLDSERHALGFITSTADTHGWLASPHFEICIANYRSANWFFEPFVMVDWVNNWQHGYTEKGRSGFNITVKDLYNSLLRSEAGLGFYQFLRYGWGRVLLKERGSYINKKPFQFNSTTTAFIGSASSFSVETGTNHMQNLAGVQCNAAFLPKNEKYPYGQIDFFGEFGSSYRSYFASFEIGKYF